jgi:alkanesulfonate monooxygenase SsuD/methylene tetrahydromethanopterin reductase-like flavin-dependent oxidoreductase (luciferase family)
MEKQHASHMLKYSIIGSPATVRRDLEAFVKLSNADELMIATSLYDHPARIRSYEIVANLVGNEGETMVTETQADTAS